MPYNIWRFVFAYSIYFTSQGGKETYFNDTNSDIDNDVTTSTGNNDKIIRISETPLEDVKKFTSKESVNDFTTLYVVIGTVGIGIIVGLVVVKRKSWFQIEIMLFIW